MKKVSILIPTYNEEDNVALLVQTIIDLFVKKLSDYRYEVVFIDNDSSDGTREIIEKYVHTIHL